MHVGYLQRNSWNGASERACCCRQRLAALLRLHAGPRGSASQQYAPSLSTGSFCTAAGILLYIIWTAGHISAARLCSWALTYHASIDTGSLLIAVTQALPYRRAGQAGDHSFRIRATHGCSRQAHRRSQGRPEPAGAGEALHSGSHGCVYPSQHLFPGKAPHACLQGQVQAFGESRLGVSPLVASREVDSLAPLHGPVVHASMAELLRLYRLVPLRRSCLSFLQHLPAWNGSPCGVTCRQWIADQQEAGAKCSAAVMYASAPLKGAASWFVNQAVYCRPCCCSRCVDVKSNPGSRVLTCCRSQVHMAIQLLWHRQSAEGSPKRVRRAGVLLHDRPSEWLHVVGVLLGLRVQTVRRLTCRCGCGNAQPREHGAGRHCGGP